MIILDQESYFNISDVFNNILSTMTIEDFKDVNNEFLEKVNECKKQLINSNIIYEDLDLLKMLYSKKDKDSIFYGDTISRDTRESFIKLDYNKEIYYNILTNSMTTKSKINETISLAKFKISISKSNIFSAMQAKVIEYYFDKITEDDLINSFYKSLNRKFMNSFKKNVSSDLSVINIFYGRTVSNVFDFKTIVDNLINNQQYNSFEIYENLCTVDFDKFNLINLTNNDLYYLFENGSKRVLEDPLIIRSAMSHIKNNLDSLDFERIKNSFEDNEISEYIDKGIAVIFDDDDFREIYEYLYSDIGSTRTERFYNCLVGRFKASRPMYAYEFFPYDKNEIYKKFITESDRELKEFDSNLFPGTSFKFSTYKDKELNGYPKIHKLISIMKYGDFTLKSIIVDDPEQFYTVIKNMNNNIDLFNNLTSFYNKISKTFTNEDLDKFVKPFLQKEKP